MLARTGLFGVNILTLSEKNKTSWADCAKDEERMEGELRVSRRRRNQKEEQKEKRIERKEIMNQSFSPNDFFSDQTESRTKLNTHAYVH